MSDLLVQAVKAKASGDVALAKQLIAQAVIQNPRNEAAWMLMANVVEEIKLRRNCLEKVLEINPDNSAARLALTRLDTSPLAPVSRGERDKPLNQPDVKTPPFTPPFTWEGDQQAYLALGEMTFPNPASEKAELPPETPTTFDWATESAEPDKTIDKIFDAVSKPDLAAQSLSDTSLSEADKTSSGDQTGTVNLDEQEKAARWLNELVGSTPEEPVEAPPEPEPDNPADFSVSLEPELGAGAFASSEISMGEPIHPESLLWDNPKALIDRMVILGNKSIIYANPVASDIPHILGLFSEKKMLRDLLGQNTGVIKLESIQRVSFNPKKTELDLVYRQDKKLITHPLVFSSTQVRNEVLEALKFRLESGVSQTTRTFSLWDKIFNPVLIMVIIAALGWGLISGLHLLNGVTFFQSGTLQVILSSVEGFMTRFGDINLLLIVVIGMLLCLYWLIRNLLKPGKIVTLEWGPQKQPGQPEK